MNAGAEKKEVEGTVHEIEVIEVTGVTEMLDAVAIVMKKGTADASAGDCPIPCPTVSLYRKKSYMLMLFENRLAIMLTR